MASRVDRPTVDLSAYPDHAVISTLHRDWWRQLLRDSGGTGFWHETYFHAPGMAAVYDDMV